MEVFTTMNKRLRKFMAVLLMLSFLAPTAACSQIEDMFDLNHDSHSSKRSRDRDDEDDDDEEEDDEDEEDETEETEETTETSASDTVTADIDPSDLTTTGYDMTALTYPDHVPTYDEIHPAHTTGSISGDAASDLLDQIEHDILQRNVGNSYVDYEILYEDPLAQGLTCDTVTWGSINSDTDEEAAFINDQLELLYSIDPDSLDYQDRAFYDKVVYDLEIDAYAIQYTAFGYYSPVFDPLIGPQCDLFFVLDVLEFETVEDAENYILLLQDLDRYFDEILDFEEDRAARGFACTDSVYEDIAASFDGLAIQEDDCFLYASFEERLNNIDGLTDDQRTQLIADHEAAMHDYVFPEFQECSDRMGALVGSGGVQQGVCNYPGGDAYYAVRFTTFANSDKTIEETTVQLDSMLTGIMDSITAIASSGDRSWYNDYLNPPCSMGDDVESNLDYLYDAVAPDFPDLPDHEYFTRDVPESLEDNFSPAAYLGYHLDTFDHNMIITNRSGVDSTFGITCAHEGYPGHMFQSVYTRSVCEHPYLYICDSVGYAEGWATYVQVYCFKYFVDNEASIVLLQADDELNCLVFARLDIGINYEGWTAEDCCDYMTELLGQPYEPEDVESMYQIATNQPGYGVKYGIGFLNTGLTIESVRAQFPDATDEEIFTAYLDALPLTFEMIEARMVESLSA